MPQCTVYIRNEDLEKWKALKKKSAWLSYYLNLADVPIESNSGRPFDILDPEQRGVTIDNRPLEETVLPFVEKNRIEEVKKIIKGNKLEMKFCQHGFAVGFCKYGCKK